jgi:hypothetical protein
MELSAWEEIREKYPETAQEIKRLGAELYELGAENALTDERLGQLAGAMRSLPETALGFFGLAPSFTNHQLLTTVFELGRKMILRLERGG